MIGGNVMIFDVDGAHSGPNQMISGKPGKGRGYYVKRRLSMIYVIRHPLVAIKFLFN